MRELDSKLRLADPPQARRRGGAHLADGHGLAPLQRRQCAHGLDAYLDEFRWRKTPVPEYSTEPHEFAGTLVLALGSEGGGLTPTVRRRADLVLTVDGPATVGAGTLSLGPLAAGSTASSGRGAIGDSVPS